MLFLQRDNPGLLRAQLDAFSRQIPLLYLTLLVNVCAMAATHLPSAPTSLTFVVPGLLSAVCVARLVMWWRTRAEAIDGRHAHKRLRSAVVLPAILGFCFVAWSSRFSPTAILGLDCVVEGVETDEQVAALRVFGCSAMQGCYFSARCRSRRRTPGLLADPWPEAPEGHSPSPRRPRAVARARA